MAKEINVNISGQWKKILSGKVRISGSWKTIKEGWVRVSNAWKQFFSSENVPSIQQQVTISQSTNSTTGLVTLTGTNYYWSDFVSLTYYFEWSSDGGSVWTIINTGSITNPISGSSNTKIYTVTQSDTSPNIDNLYRFRVFAQNVTLTNSSTSTSTTISTPRNVTNVSASQIGTTKQATISFTPGLYTNSVRISRKKYNGATLEESIDFDKTTASPVSIPLDSYGKTYKFTIKPYTGSLQSDSFGQYVVGYSGNTTAETSGFYSNYPPAPVQITKPTLSSTGSISIGTTLTATGGQQNPTRYETDTYSGSIVTKVYAWQHPGPTLTSGTTTSPGQNQQSASTSFTTNQTHVNYVFYAVDIVTSADGLSTYYFYSDLSATAFLPSFSDNFNRNATTGSQGIGVTSTGSWIWANDMVGTYGWMMPVVDTDNVSWQIDYDEVSGRRTAYTSKNPTFANDVSHYPLKSINVGDGNVSLKVSIPDGGGGPGLAFWVTNSGSWWAVAPSYYKQDSTVTTYPCSDGPYSHTSTTCPATSPGSTTVGTICSCTEGSSSTTYACDGGPEDAISCPAGPYSSTAANVGLRCSSCTSVSTTTCTGSGACASNTSGGCCPATGSADGQRCSACVGFNVCSTEVTFEVKQSLNPNGNGSCNTYCGCLGPYTNNGTSTCGTTVSELISYTNPVVYSCTTAADAGKICSATLIGIDRYNVKYCQLGTAAYTYWNCNIRSCGSTYNTNQTTTLQRYNTVKATTTTVNASYYKVTTGTATTTTYYSRIKILSASGSAVTSSYLDSGSSSSGELVASSNTAYELIKGLEVSTSGNTITAKAYSNTALSTQIGNTKTYTATNPTKTLAGDSSVGIINTPTDQNRLTGNRLDDFIYTNV